MNRLLPLHAFARSHIGFIGDALNLSTRLTGEAELGEIVVSNAFYQTLEPAMGRPHRRH